MKESIYILLAFALVAFTLLFGTSLKLSKWIKKVVVRAIVGTMMLFILNILGANHGIHMPINLYTSAMSGVLGVPGIGALLVIKYWNV